MKLTVLGILVGHFGMLDVCVRIFEVRKQLGKAMCILLVNGTFMSFLFLPFLC